MTSFVIFVVVMIVVSLITKARQQSTRGNGTPSPKMQALIERIQAQQGGGNQPTQFQGQFTQPAGYGKAQGSEQAAAALQQVLHNGRQPTGPGEWSASGRAPAQPGAATPYPPAGNYQPPGQFQAAQYPVEYPVQLNQGPYQPPGHRPQQNNLPTANQDLDAKVLELMSAGNEVGAIRLLSDERELGILAAQEYARSLVAPQSAPQGAQDNSQESADGPDAPQDEERYVGSAAISESIFNLDDRDDNVWASGWVDTPEPDDRSDIDELWQIVSNPPRPTPPTSQ